MSLFRADPGVVDDRAIEVLAEACIGRYDEALAVVRSWHEAGCELENIYLCGLAPAAEMLGLWWLEDRIDFVKVTSGTHSLQQILYEFSPQFLYQVGKRFNTYRAVFFSQPGSQHSFSDMKGGKL